MTDPTLTDAEVLEVLHLTRTLGRTMKQAAEWLSATTGRPYTRSAVAGLLKRVEEAAEPSAHDGTMDPEWWRDGLDARQAAHAEAG